MLFTYENAITLGDGEKIYIFWNGVLLKDYFIDKSNINKAEVQFSTSHFSFDFSFGGPVYIYRCLNKCLINHRF